jgi:hypothetical protein
MPPGDCYPRYSCKSLKPHQMVDAFRLRLGLYGKTFLDNTFHLAVTSTPAGQVVSQRGFNTRYEMRRPR